MNVPNNSRPAKSIKLFPNLSEEERAERLAKQKEQAEKNRIEMEEAARLAVPREIERLKKESNQISQKAELLENALKEFPDLRIYEGRWKKIVYYSKLVNSQVDNYDLRHNCGCCNDSPLELWPYIETKYGKIYSSPPRFVIGQRDYICDCGDTPYENWEKDLIDNNIPESIVNKIKNYFAECENSRECLEEND